MNRRLKYVPMLCVCLIGMLVSCGTVKRTSGVSGNKTVVEEKDPLTPEQRRKYDYFFLEALRMKEKGDLDAAFEMYSHCLDIYPQGAATLFEISRFHMFLNQPEKGEEALKKAVDADPKSFGTSKLWQPIIKVREITRKPFMFMRIWRVSSPHVWNR